MHGFVNIFFILLFVSGGAFPGSTLRAAGPLSRLAIKIHIAHTHEHEHSHHHHDEIESEVPLNEILHSTPSNAKTSRPASNHHHSDKHSHEQYVSCGHVMLLANQQIEIAAIDFRSVYSFEFKRSAPPSRALNTIFRPPIQS
ncbi:hypothetical protein BH10BDE1_BH10BDE1_27830 [soil metagenome]